MPINASELTAQQQITAIYVAYYDRAPDPAGLQFWVDQLEGGRSLEQIATDFSGAAETIQKFPFFEAPELASADNFIVSIYTNLFGRTPDAEGQAFWSDALESGTVPVGEIILAILEGAQDEASGGFPDSETVTNKIDVGLDWAIAAANAGVGTPSNLIAEEVDGELVVNNQDAFESATSILDGVTGDPQSVTDAETATGEFFEGAANAGETLVLTTGQDNVQGTQGDDNILGLFEDGATDTLTLGDNINGQAGDDTVTIVSDSNSNLSFSGKTFTGIENLVVENAADGLDTINFAGKEIDNLTLDVGTTDVDMNINMNGVAASSAVTVQNIGGDANHNVNVFFNSSSAMSGSTTVTFQDLDVNEFDSNIDATFSAATEHELNLTALNVDSNDNFNMNANIELGAADVALAINVDLTNVVGEDVDVNLDYNTNGVASTNAVFNLVDSNVNDIDLDIDSNNQGTGDQDVLTINASSLNTDGNQNQEAEINADWFETVNINVDGNGAVFDDLDFFTNDDNDFALNIVANADMTVDSDINMNGNVGSSTITVSGAGNVELGDVDFNNDGNDNTVMTIDASALTGDLTLEDGNVSGGISSIDSLISGSGADSIGLRGGFTAVVDTGAGDDAVDTGGADYGDANAGTLDGGDGIDVIAIDDGALLDADYADNISNFEVLDFSDGTGTYDLSIEESLDDIRATGSIAAPVTITEFAAANSLTLTDFVDADAITVTLADDTAADATTVNLVAEDTSENTTADGETDAVLVMEEFETLTVNSTGLNTAGDVDGNDVAFVSSDYENTVNLDASDMTNLNVTGDAQTSITFTGAEALTQVNAAANTAGVTVDASTGGIVGGISFAGTDADDTFTATANGDIIQGNAGVDTITLGAGEDVVRYAAQSDSVLTLTDTSDPADGVADEGTGWDIVNGFTTGDDTIELSSLLGLATGDARSAVLQKGDVDGANGTAGFQIDDLQSAVGDGLDFFSDGLVDRAVAFASSTDLGDGFVLIDANGDGDFNADDDMAIQLTGVTTLTVDDLQFG